ncbi:MAG: bifunctional aldolase/short-chain dehydrogenase [Alphaproteobacteria bacterium]|jgi:rhamnose utilization protein RhaD (predicted bifunctional aldolase and dehydrogenase)/NAD(P)-dependent dehydrogenase (short-subunit alcohol dehydrogenase family)|nr:bifunctional aldolase/short-chain dehydrogenase [Alphaproteobacteria bacterium]
MDNLWSDREAQACIKECDGAGINEQLALRLYSARLLGSNRNLVLHGGGNASLKAEITDPLGEVQPVLCIKGSGWDMARLEAPGLPAVRLEPLRRLRMLDSLDDLATVNMLRGNLLDTQAADPSVETLLHAFLPHAYVDHTHASAILALSDQPDGDKICAEVFAGKAAIAPYRMSGLALAKAAAQAYEDQPDCRGLILSKHGVVSFGETAAEAYAAMIELVNLAEDHLSWGRPKVFPSIALPSTVPTAAQVGPILRAALSCPDLTMPGGYRRVVLDHRGGDAVLNFVNGQELSRYGQAGVVTPDHAIRTKGLPLILPAPDGENLDSFAETATAAVADYVTAYEDYFKRHAGADTVMVNPLPKVVLVPGVGLFAADRGADDAAIVADIAENAVAVIGAAEAHGRFESIAENDLFDIEYWSLEQAKLNRTAEPALAGHVVAVTGGAGGIGAATAAAFAAEGAAVAVLDLDAEQAAATAGRFGGLGLGCDVTDTGAVQETFDRICQAHGGIDIVVSNAGAAWQGKIGEVDDALLRRSFELNFFAHQLVAKCAVAVMLQQGTGGVLLFNASKQAVNPGPDFGPYGLPKAATMFLMRQYAVDYGEVGIRSNAINADRIRSGLLTEDMVAARSTARGVSETDYMAGNLLQREVTAEDVAQAFVNLAKSEKTTGAVLTVDGGNIAAALR